MSNYTTGYNRVMKTARIADALMRPNTLATLGTAAGLTAANNPDEEDMPLGQAAAGAVGGYAGGYLGGTVGGLTVGMPASVGAALGSAATVDRAPRVSGALRRLIGPAMVASAIGGALLGGYSGGNALEALRQQVTGD